MEPFRFIRRSKVSPTCSRKPSGQYTYTAPGFNNRYRRAAEPSMQYHQAIYHAQAHDRARAYDRMCGVIAWCAFEYGSPNNGYKGVKNPGVADVFRIPKLGATFYQSQVSPSVRPVIEPNFYWDFGTMTPQGPGKNLAIFHNCDRLEVLSAKSFTLRWSRIARGIRTCCMRLRGWIWRWMEAAIQSCVSTASSTAEGAQSTVLVRSCAGSVCRCDR